MLCGLLLTHNLMTFITSIFACIYVCINITKLKDKQILKELIINIILIILISSIFWMPFLQTYLSTNYAVYEDNGMATSDSFKNSALDFSKLFTTPQDDVYVYQIGFIVVIAMVLSIFAITKVIKTNYKKEYFLFLILGILCVLAATNIFPWHIFGTSVYMLQFTWRMLVFANFFLAIVCAINLGTIIKNFKIFDIAFFTFIAILCVMPLKTHIPTNETIIDIDQFAIGNIGENRQNAIAGMGKGEYLPTNSNNNREYIIERKNEIYVLQGNAHIYNTNKNGSKLSSNLDILDDNTILELPFIYYPGYTVTINGDKIRSFESENGFLTVSLSKMNNITLEVNYTGTTLMHLSKFISLFGILLLLYRGTKAM